MKKVFLICAGSLSLALGVVGIVLPMLPTTPFLLLAAACFSASSQRMHAFLMRNKYLGAYIENYKNKRGVPLRVKVTSLITLWAMLALSAVLIHKLWIVVLLSVVGVAVTAHLMTIKTKRE